jgi:ectoine hydroxylase-related dioxygenase (phytanoyl-CoA dioxygenase family)
VSILPQLLAFAGTLPANRAGVRISVAPTLRSFLQPKGAIGTVAASILGDRCRAVRAILFDKTEALNWSLGWHQDRTICVRARRKVQGFGSWTVKQGAHHVEPPFDLLATMVTLRVHLDEVLSDNGPLLIAPGSHRLGRVNEDSIEAAVSRCGIVACTARAGDVWLYSTPILHASQPSRRPERRRVLQVDYSADALPGALEWAGV